MGKWCRLRIKGEEVEGGGKAGEQLAWMFGVNKLLRLDIGLSIVSGGHDPGTCQAIRVSLT